MAPRPRDPVTQCLKSSDEVRVEKVLSDVEQLFPSNEYSIRNLFLGFSEQVWNEEGAGAYVLQNAESFRDRLSQVGRIAFSPVPRGWIDDSLIDVQIAVDQIHKRLTSKPKRSVFEPILALKRSYLSDFWKTCILSHFESLYGKGLGHCPKFQPILNTVTQT